MTDTRSIDTVTVDGRRIAYRRFGVVGAPPLLLVHGLYGDSSTVAALAERLAETFDVVAPDALGHGRSDHPAALTFDDQGAALLGLATALGFETFSMLGISMGSYLAAKAATMSPQRVEGLVLVVAKAHGLTSSSAAFAERRGFDLAAATQEQAFAFLAEAVWAPETSPDVRAAIGAELVGDVGLTPAERAVVEQSLAGFDLRPSLGRITARTLVVSGRHDGLNPPEAGREVADAIPGARFEVYEHSGHALAGEERERLVADVTTFLGR